MASASSPGLSIFALTVLASDSGNSKWASVGLGDK